jgi:membrane-associated phospholipid phosphatase
VLALMTMLGVHSLAVLGAIVVGVLVVWLGWSLLDRRRPASDGGP